MINMSKQLMDSSRLMAILKDYENDRGMYFPFQDYVYGEVTITNDELIEAIKKALKEFLPECF